MVFQGVACPDGSGGAIVAWSDGRDGQYLEPNIFVQHLRGGGTLDPVWPQSGSLIVAMPGAQWVVSVLPGGDGGALIVWLDTRDGPSVGDVIGHIYAIRITPEGTAHEGWPAGGLPVYTASSVTSDFAVAPDGADGAFVAWMDRRTGERDIRMQHVLASGVIPAGWPVDGVPVCTALGDQWTPRLTPDGAGGVLVSWSDYRGVGSRVYVQHIDGSGLPAPGWPDNGLPADRSGAPIYQVDNVSIGDGEGGAYLAWVNNDGSMSQEQVRVQRLRSDGSIAFGWPPEGVLLAWGAGARYSLAASGDGAGGFCLVWRDTRYTLDLNRPDIFVQRVLASGAVAPGWPGNGLVVCRDSANQWLPQVVPDGSGGLYAAWIDERDFASTGSHVYATHVNASGIPADGWPADGRRISRAESGQYLTSLIPDGRGGALAFWSDYVAGGYDILAQLLVSEGAASSAYVLESVATTPDRVTVRWRAPTGIIPPAILSRFLDREGWRDLGAVVADASRIVEYVDREVVAGERYLYRLSTSEGGITRFYGAVWVTVPVDLRLRGPFPDPARGALSFTVTLTGPEPARFELFDVVGRLVWSRELGGLGAGTHAVRPAPSRWLPAGIYIARLTTGGRVLTKRSCLVR